MNLKSIFLIATLTILIFGASGQNVKNATDDVYVKKTEMREGKKTDIFIIEKDDKAYQIEKQNSTIIKFVVDGNAIAKSELPKYKEQIKTLLEAYDTYAKTHNSPNRNEQYLDDEKGVKINVNKKVAVRLYDEDIANAYESGKKIGTKILNSITNIFK